MTEQEPIAATPKLRAAQRWNVVWAVPILALLIGGWMLYRDISSKGPEVRIRFDTADGIVAGKTEVRCRSVTVGRVSRVELAEDLQSVLVYCRLGSGDGTLLRKGTRFWVVRPRVSATDISGLGTLLTGVYIELDPGTGDLGPRLYKGRETPPATSRSVPGRRVTLVTEEAGSLTAGSPVYFRGFEVGRVESRKLETEQRQIVYEVFIREQYGSLVRDNTRFWNTSGIDVSAGVDGFKLRTPSFQAMVSGGVAFGVPEGLVSGEEVTDGAVFELHASAASAAASTFEPTLQLLLLFDQSVRGLSKSAPVEFRGIVIGRVINISFDYVKEEDNHLVPVLVEIDPNLVRAASDAVAEGDHIEALGEAVKRGLRATLRTGSLLTGALFVDFDFHDDDAAAELTFMSDYPVVPTVESGLVQLEAKLTSILDKIDSLNLEEAVDQIARAADETANTVAEAKGTLTQIEEAVAAAKSTLEDPAFRQLPADLRKSLATLDSSLSSVGPEGAIQGDLLRTLDELRASLRAFRSLTDAIDEKPNSLLFGKESSGNPRPRAAGKR